MVHIFYFLFASVWKFYAFSWRRQPSFVIAFLLPSYMKYLQCSRVLNILQLQPKTRGHVKHHSKASMIFICKDLRRLDIEISVDSFSLRSIKRRVSVFSLHTHTATLRIYIRGFTKFDIKVLWRLQVLEYLRTLSLKFQKARTKIEVVLSLPCWLSQFIVVRAFWNFKCKVFKHSRTCSLHNTLIQTWWNP